MPAARSASCSRRCRSPRCGWWRHRRGLARVGLKRIGDIVDLPRAPLTARFGDLLRQLDRALGREHEPLNPRLPVAPYVAEQRFAEPIAREEDVLGTVQRLAARLEFALERRGDGARRIELTLFRTDGELRRIAVGCSRPLRDEAISARCSSSGSPRSPTNSIPASASTWRGCRWWSPSPARPNRSASAAPRMPPSIDRLVDRLSARLGARRVRRLIAQDSHIPEIAACSVPAQMRRRSPAGRHFAVSAPRRSSRRARCGCCRGRSRSRRSPKCRTARRCASGGGARCTR